MKYGLLFFVLMILVITFQFTAVPWIVFGQPHGGDFTTTVVAALANALFLASPYWLLPRRQRGLAWLLITLTTIWGLSQLFYFPTYDDIMPVQVFTLTGNVNGLLIDSIIGSVRWYDLWVVLPPFVLAFIPIGKIQHALPLWFKHNGHDYIEKRCNTKGFWGTLAVAVATLMLNNINLFTGPEPFKQKWEQRYATCYVNAKYCGENGIIPYLAYSCLEWQHSYKALDANEKQELGDFLKKEIPVYSDNGHAAWGRKNLIIVIVESMQSWPLGLKINGKEVCPTMNRLMASPGVISCKNVISQISYGHSSDGHFIYDTGLLPLLQGSVAISFGDRNFPSLPKALQGYDKREIMVNEASSWNQTATPFSYGFNKLYARAELARALKRNNNIDDNALFDFVNNEVLPQVKQPFMLQMVTLTMHTPHKAGKVPETWITKSNAYNETGRNFLNEVYNFDRQLAQLYKKLKALNMDKNTVVAIVSDHNELDLNKVEGRTQASLHDVAIPVIITGADTTLHHKAVMGQVDIYPTLLDVMGLNNYSWKGLGHSILRYPVTSAINKRHEMYGKENHLTKQQRRAWNMSTLYIRNLANKNQ